MVTTHRIVMLTLVVISLLTASAVAQDEDEPQGDAIEISEPFATVIETITPEATVTPVPLPATATASPPMSEAQPTATVSMGRQGIGGCADTPSLVTDGFQIAANGFRAGSAVSIWLVGPVRNRSSVARPFRDADATAYADEDCAVYRRLGWSIRANGDYALYLAGSRHGGGSELTMFRVVPMTQEYRSR